MAKKVLIHCHVFSPDGVSSAYLYNDIALALQAAGYEVEVLTTTPHFNVLPEALAAQPLHWKVPGIVKQSDFHGIRVWHVPQKKFGSTALRLLGFVWWHIVAFFVGLTIRDVDVVLSPSPVLTVGLLNLWFKRLKGCKVVYNVQEIYPDLMHLQPGLMLRTLQRIERKVYDGSDAVTTIDQVFHDTIAGRFRDPSKLRIIPNFVDTQLYHPGTGHPDLDPALFPETEDLRVVYAGNIGIAQDWEPLLALAKAMCGRPVSFFVIGEGARRDALVAQKAALGLDNLHILPYQRRDRMAQVLDYSDLQFIFMHPDMEGEGFPSKVYTVMACGRPLLVCSGEGTPLVNFLSDKGCAELVTERDPDRKVGRMSAWLGSVSRAELRAMGERGLQVIARHYSKDVVTRQYVALMDELTA